ncbi:T9SS type A sorting domain-containing protein [Fluviicola taffensis]|uniref:Secretion system C-terminal sorting domain-containing protein n=1 Tax=Fluviicola taffensis (strain DSM 16823 / NCIMB 13979 / RW262) TaxID=755732 RepID=F2IIC2_FLUTR|nr:T9SS type A sorting domain-containing protein [Fluviicola taffensis]AEA43831.1 hypothetical protein Fluta_1844 [Fluviicola taffensis DSM 16823]
MRSLKLTSSLWILMLVVIFTQDVYAQYPTPNMPGWHAKYWFYRWRLRNDFMVMGDGPGQSLVAESRNLGRNEYMAWSDCMIMHGYYLTMLAIEHRILEEKGRWADLKNNERELYYAIKAFERVDDISETFYSGQGDKGDEEAFRLGDWTLSHDVNGYFHRDDVPPDFINRNQWIDTFNYIAPDFTTNYYKLKSGKTGIDYGADLKYNRSAYSDLWEDNIQGYQHSPHKLDAKQFPIVNFKKGEEEEGYYGYSEASVDQIIRLLLGFFTITKSIPNVYYDIDLDKDGDIDVSFNINEQARRHSTNILGRLAGKFSGTLDVASPYSPTTWAYPSLHLHATGGNGYWTVINPRGNQVSEGAVIFNYMPPMQKVSAPLFTSNNDLEITNATHAAFPASSLYTTWWNSGLNGYSEPGNVKMSLILNAISNSGSGVLPVGTFIYNKSADHHYQALYTPLYDYLWGWNPSLQVNKNKKAQAYQYASEMLSMAPCVGPHNFCKTNTIDSQWGFTYPPFSDNQDPDGIPYYWNVPFVFDNNHDQWDDGLDLTEGWFSGVDYMMLYNLVYANNDEAQPLYHDLINRLIDYDINTDSYTNLMNVSGVGLMLGAFENMKITGNIYGSTPVTVKALEYVQIDNGLIDPFPNGSVTIETGKVTCGNDFTSQNTPYSIDQCQTCNLEEQLGTLFIPETSGKSESNYMEMPELEEDNRLGINESDESTISIFPNPTSDFFVISESFQEIIILDQNGSEVKRFDNRAQICDIQKLSSGLYTLIIKLNEYETEHIKLVKI